MNYTNKVKAAMKKHELSELDICAKLKITQMTLRARFRDDDWWLSEIRILNKLLNINL